MNKKEEQNIWKIYINSFVKLFIEDAPNPYPRKKVGLMVADSDTHIFLKVFNKDKPIGFEKSSIKRFEPATEEEANANY